jgi:hypothetical protein
MPNKDFVDKLRAMSPAPEGNLTAGLAPGSQVIPMRVLENVGKAVRDHQQGSMRTEDPTDPLVCPDCGGRKRAKQARCDSCKQKITTKKNSANKVRRYHEAEGLADTIRRMEGISKEIVTLVQRLQTVPGYEPTEREANLCLMIFDGHLLTPFESRQLDQIEARKKAREAEAP